MAKNIIGGICRYSPSNIIIFLTIVVGLALTFAGLFLYLVGVVGLTNILFVLFMLGGSIFIFVSLIYLIYNRLCRRGFNLINKELNNHIRLMEQKLI